MKVNYSVTLEATDVVEAINTYLTSNGVNATVKLDDLINGMNDDLSIEIKTQGDAPVTDKPVKRRRRASSKAVKEDATPSSVKIVTGDDGEQRPQTIREEANESNEKRILEEEKKVTEKVKAVNINDEPDQDVADADPEPDSDVPDDIETETVINDKKSSVPLAKQGIFKKRVKK